MVGWGGRTRVDAAPRPAVRRLLAAAAIVALGAAIACASIASAAKPGPQTFRLVPDGQPELVYGYGTQRCDDHDFPDLPARAFRARDGSVVLYYGSSNGARAFVGPHLDHVQHRCNLIFVWRGSDDPSRYAMQEWLGGGYTPDGKTVYALVHEEYHGEGNTRCVAPQIPVTDGLSCWMAAITAAVSTDGGRTFHPTGRAVATLP